MFITAESEEPALPRPFVSYNSGNTEWYTPAGYIELAREVMGCIDIDPASSEIANKVVGAKGYYTIETDGLSNGWFGKVWLNPPYSVELIPKFTEKLLDGLLNIEEAIVLVNNVTETEWFNKLVSSSSGVCFPKGRVKFRMPDGTTGAPLQGQALPYFGGNSGRFVEIFRRKGWCAVPR